uniref:Uncharacterized protein n=2 Tax=Sphaerodactylus townsendi TaxID=933632 RepID=A0ACB8E5K1_9SAUR
MPEGGTAEITSELLRSEDEDTPPEEVFYSIRTPVNGKVVLKSSPQNRALRFSQSQINSRLVQFVHEGAPEGGFSFDVSDGENMSPGHFFAVVAHRKPTIALENKQDLTVCPGSSWPITRQNLKATANDEAEARSIVYIIERPPKFGKLVKSLKGSKEEDLKNFTQAEVDNGEIFYQHDMPDRPFWLLHDAFHFRISSPSTTTDPYILRLSVSFEISCPRHTTQLWRNKGLVVPEAQSAVIDTSVLDASNLLAKEPESKRAAYDVIFLITELPQYGSLSLPDGPVNRRHPYFLQSNLKEGGLEYAHHGSGLLDDHFKFNAWLRGAAVESLQPPQKGEEVVISGTFNITVSDSNEMPPELITQGGVLQVLHNSPVVLSQEYLNVMDPDSSPGEIQYEVLSGSSNGFVVNVLNKQVPLTHFTQADINDGHLMFIANKTNSPRTLDLSISDGRNPPIFTSLEVMVLPATTWATNQTPLEIAQEVNMAPLSQGHLLGASERGDPNTFYRLIRDPQFGQVQVRQKPAGDFSQKQVDDKEVTFTFTDFTSPKDEFQFIATSGGVNISGTVNVTVKALVKSQEEILWPRGTTIVLNTDVLDASELANRTKSVPVFKILRAPRGSHFVKVFRDKGDHPTPIDAFDQRDLERGMVALEIWDEDSRPGLQQDSFQFELVAEGVPPALASVTYSTEAFNSSTTYGATLLHAPDLQDGHHRPATQSTAPSSTTHASWLQGSEAPGHGSSKPPVRPTAWAGHGATTSASPAEKGTLLSFIEANMFSVILPICLILLLLALILPLLFYLHKRNKTGKHDVQGTPPKYKNGTVGDQETFRKTDPNQAIPLMTVNTLEAKGPVSKGPAGQQDPELLQYCRTSNPALKNSQYWV